MILITPEQLREIVASEIYKALSQMQSKETTSEQEYLTTSQVCKLLSLSRVTLNVYEKKNRLNPVRVGRNLRYKMTDVKNLMK